MFLSEGKGFPVYEHCKTAALLMLVIAIALSAFAQSQTGDHSAQTAASASKGQERKETNKLTFEVTSVRGNSQTPVRGAEFLDPDSHEQPQKGGLLLWNVRVGQLIAFAYDLRHQQFAAMWESLPNWAKYDKYAIKARAADNSTRAEVRQMVRSLLEERFKLAAHSETRDGQVSELVLARRGVRLKPHPAGAPCKLSLPKVWALPTYEDRPAQCGIFDRELGKYKRRLEMLDVTVQQIADYLGRESSPVVDRTGLTGHYDAVLDWGPGVVLNEDFSNYPAESSQEIGPLMPRALEKQLGLKAVTRKAPTEVFVIEHIEKPSEN